MRGFVARPALSVEVGRSSVLLPFTRRAGRGETPIQADSVSAARGVLDCFSGLAVLDLYRLPVRPWCRSREAEVHTLGGRGCTARRLCAQPPFGRAIHIV